MTENQGYIYILKEDTHFALITICGNVIEEEYYITLSDYEDIQDIDIYFDSDIETEECLHPFDMSKFYKIPVENSDRPSIKDLLDFTQNKPK